MRWAARHYLREGDYRYRAWFCLIPYRLAYKPQWVWLERVWVRQKWYGYDMGWGSVGENWLLGEDMVAERLKWGQKP